MLNTGATLLSFCPVWRQHIEAETSLKDDDPLFDHVNLLIPSPVTNCLCSSFHSYSYLTEFGLGKYLDLFAK